MTAPQEKDKKMEKTIFEKKCCDCEAIFETEYQLKVICSFCQYMRDLADMAKYGTE